jgi:hypothetical protein
MTRLLLNRANKISHFLQSIFPATRAGKIMGRPVKGERRCPLLAKADLPKAAIDVAIGGKADTDFCAASVLTTQGGLQWQQSPISCLQKTRNPRSHMPVRHAYYDRGRRSRQLFFTKA